MWVSSSHKQALPAVAIEPDVGVTACMMVMMGYPTQAEQLLLKENEEMSDETLKKAQEEAKL